MKIDRSPFFLLLLLRAFALGSSAFSVDPRKLYLYLIYSREIYEGYISSWRLWKV